MLKVSKKPDGSPEIFISIQGEGENIGKPAVFLRLALCNLRCTWCDTRYTWDWEKFDPAEQVLEMSPENVKKEILKYPHRYLVLTGGEPLLQQKTLIPLLERLKKAGFFLEFETNGTIRPEAGLLELVGHWSVSPKLLNSGNPQNLREIPECYQLFAGLTNSHFKYVIQNEDDFREVQALVEKHQLSSEKVILMPEARNRDELLERSRWLAELCLTRGYRFSTRLQTLLWGNERGK